MSTSSFVERLQALEQAMNQTQVATQADLQAFKQQYVSKQGAIAELMQAVKTMDLETKRSIGPQLQALKTQAMDLFKAHARSCTSTEARPAVAKDLSLPVQTFPKGSLHPITQFARRIMDQLHAQGFVQVSGPEIESDWYNFSALNFPPDHPARDMQDTFFIQHNPDILLRTHSSSVQVRMMEKHTPPLRLFTYGPVYRNEAITARSHVFFHQIEGLFIDQGVSFLDLKQTLLHVVQRLFGAQIPTRFRPSFFPFTEPSAELDIGCMVCQQRGCALCKHTGWLEVAGCGLVDEAVLRNCQVDVQQYSGYAFGMGVDRLAMLHYGIEDIRLFSQNDVRFLRQFA